MSSPRILILMSDTGAGHRASAEALRAGFHNRFGARFQVEIIDLLRDHLPPPACYLPATYPELVNRAPGLWNALWNVDIRYMAPIVGGATRLALTRLRRTFAAYQPDLIISVHPLMQEAARLALNGSAHSRYVTGPFTTVPFVTVVTDLITVHPLWFNPAVRRCYVASEAALRQAGKRGLSAAQLRLYGLPIRPDFAAPSPGRLHARAALGLEPNLPAALIIGGSVGRGQVAEIARATAHALRGTRENGPHGQLIVVCGANARLRTEMLAQPWPVPTRVLGFVDNMAAWMHAADCVVTKAGPGAIAEALACGLPIILSGYIPGQEAGNVPFIANNGAGCLLTEPAAIAAQIAAWFGPERAELEAISARATRLAKPQATAQIVENIAGLIEGE